MDNLVPTWKSCWEDSTGIAVCKALGMVPDTKQMLNTFDSYLLTSEDEIKAERLKVIQWVAGRMIT